MAKTGSLNYAACVDWLNGCGRNDYTQFGEDGLIEACLSHIGETNRQCFEIGAADGLFFSNTLRLREQGWEALLIEGNWDLFQKLDATYGDAAWCIYESCEDLHQPLDYAKFESTPDLGVIDIDGQDYWLWHDLTEYKPRVMMVEISTRGKESGIPKRGEAFPSQAGLTAITELGKNKGYTLVAHTYCNALFVDTEELRKADCD